ncbi:MAG: prephenate dehydratase [Candidatus Omnitrophica bacterium]|nr:prephenate dehydratase [Candidatus Omnitrophota bacterium]
MPLKRLRKQIDAADKQIVELLNKRARIIVDIGARKSKQGAAAYCPEREREVLARIAALNRGPLSTAALEAIYREVMSGSLSLEKKLTIAYLGPPATFTHQAALKRFGSQVSYVSCESIADVFAEVEKGSADYGVVPIENSIEGAVNHTLDMFVDSDLKICAQVILDISHNLLSRSPLKKIAAVYSKAEVFGQCRIWLQKNMPGVDHVEVSSTTKAAQIAGATGSAGCIASALAAKMYGLNTVARSIEDSPHNRTRFFVIGTTDTAPTGRDKTSLLFSIKDKVGALHEMLMPFKKYKVNLNKIESRPSKKRAWDYYFFVDLEGHQQSPRIHKALRELEHKCKFLKILGSYPVGA